MKIAITGASGQLGRELSRVLGPCCKLTLLTKEVMDVTNQLLVKETFAQLKPDVIVHAAAYTDVDGAERNPELALCVNGSGTSYVAAAAESINAKLVCISTDYVFDGCKGSPYIERDDVSPINVYGASKLQGERLAMQLCQRLFIVRTSWLFGSGRRNFVKSMVLLMQNQRIVKAAEDAVGSPTYTLDLACFIRQLIDTDAYGIYHAANTGFCSRYTWAATIQALVGCEDMKLVPASTKEFQLPARRPANSALASTEITRRGFSQLRDWKSALSDYLQRENLAVPAVQKERFR